MRIDTLQSKQETLISQFYSVSKNCHKLIEKIERTTNNLYRDICMAQTLHPELAYLFRQFSAELCSLDHKFKQSLELSGFIKSDSIDKSEMPPYQRRFCAIQALKQHICDIKLNKIRKEDKRKKSAFRIFLCRGLFSSSLP